MHHNHRIKIVPFKQADNDETIPTKLFQTLYTVLFMYTQTACLKELRTLFSHLNMFFLHNDL